MSSNLQASSARTYSSVIDSLQSAQRKIIAAQGEVNGQRSSLSHAYQGEDGALFGQKLDEWLDEGTQILNLCSLMQETLTQASQRSAATQQHAVSAVHNVRTGDGTGVSISQNTYNQMTG
ncbi:hypothetical protein [Streptomyces humi]